MSESRAPLSETAKGGPHPVPIEVQTLASRATAHHILAVFVPKAFMLPGVGIPVRIWYWDNCKVLGRRVGVIQSGNGGEFRETEPCVRAA